MQTTVSFNKEQIELWKKTGTSLPFSTFVKNAFHLAIDKMLQEKKVTQ